KRADENALVAAVEANVVAVNENPLNAVGGNAGDAKITPVGGAHNHVGNDSNAVPMRFSGAARGVQNVRTQWRSGAGLRVAEEFQGNLTIGDDMAYGVEDIVG